MANIIGTTIRIEEYLSRTEVNITIQSSKDTPQQITLYADREYIIPYFQREIRWDIGNINALLSDLSRGAIFLGNIIMSIRSDHKCEIIDGQQRTTILLMILSWLKAKYHDRIELLTPCRITNQSFDRLQTLLDKGIILKEADSETEQEIKESDLLGQWKTLKAIWNELDKSIILNDRHSAIALVENLKKSCVSIVASHNESVNESIRHFLDVNLKGVRLDSEDIFKSYLMRYDNSTDILKLWQHNKRIVSKINLAKGGTENKRYPLMKIYEHCLYCDLYDIENSGEDYSQVKFGEDFCLSDNEDIGGHRFYKGTHIIEVISDKEYMRQLLKKVEKALEVMSDIVVNDGPSDFFKALFISDKKIDSLDVYNCHSLLQKILLEKEVVPKVLALKYIMSYLDGTKHKKEEYKTIYSVFAASVIFTVFATKKVGQRFYGFVRTSDWIKEINNWLYEYTSSHSLTKGKLLASYKYTEDDEGRSDIRCKSLAAILNFFELKKDGNTVIMKISDTRRLNEYLIDKVRFSLEHFIIANSGKLKIKTNKFDFMYGYPSETLRYRNSLFNYIFIPESVNNEIENADIYTKCHEIEIDELECQYSQSYCRIINELSCFSRYPKMEFIDSFDNEEDVKDHLDDYFKRYFPDDFLAFASSVLKVANWPKNI
ncbi:MAG: DUF262 domain-containing protein [Prevotella sp.]|nr:DUF262 domain-containing protein [Prevotella sp.]